VSSIYKLFKSIKLAVVLILYITVTSILATLIPQGKELGFYYHAYPSFLSWIIINTGFNNFFTSGFFLVPIVVFIVNLSVCSIDRLVKQIRKTGKKRFGPDILHIGLLVLAVGAIVTFTGRREGFAYLAEGDRVRLPGDYVMELESFEFHTYESGRPKAWISTVNVYDEQGKVIVDSYPIRVNHPLRIGRIKIYQSSYSEEATVTLIHNSGEKKDLKRGYHINVGDELYFFRGVYSGSGNSDDVKVVFEKWDGQEITGMVSLGRNQQVGEYRIGKISNHLVTGLQAVVDPGYTTVLIAVILIGLGLSVTYIQKLGEKQS